MAATEWGGEVIVKDTRMETGKWYPENEGEEITQRIGTAILCILCVALYLVIGYGLLVRPLG